MAAYEKSTPRVDKFLNGTWVWLDHEKKYKLTFQELAKFVNQNLINSDTYLYNRGFGLSNWYRLKDIDGLNEAVSAYLNSPRNSGQEIYRSEGRTTGDRGQRKKSNVAYASAQGQKLTHAAERARSAECVHRHGRSETKSQVRSYSLSTESSRTARQRTMNSTKPYDHSRTSPNTDNGERKTSRSNNDRSARSPNGSKTRSVSRNVEREEQWKHHWRATQSTSFRHMKERMSRSNFESHRGQRGTRTQTLSAKTSVGSVSGLKSSGSPRKTCGPLINERKMLEEPGRVHLQNDNSKNRKYEFSSDEEAKNQEGNLRQGRENTQSMSNASKVLNKPTARRHRVRRPSDTSTIVSNVSITSTKRLSRLHPDIQDRRKMMMHRERLNQQKRELEVRKAQVELKKQQLANLRSEYTERAKGHKYIQATEQKDLFQEQAELKAFKSRLQEEVMNPSIFARSPVVAIKNAPGMLDKHEKLLSKSIEDRQQLHQECVKISQELGKVCRAVRNIYSSKTDQHSERDRHDPNLGSLLLLEKEKAKIKQELENSSSKLQTGDVSVEAVKETSVSGANKKYLSPVPLNSSLHLNKFQSYDTGFTSDFEYENLRLDINSSDASEDGEGLATGRRFVVNLHDLDTTDCSPSPRDYRRDEEQRRELLDNRDCRSFKPLRRPRSNPGREGREPVIPLRRVQTSRVHGTKGPTKRTQRIYRRKVEEQWDAEDWREDRQIKIHSQKTKPNPLFTFLASDRSSDIVRDRQVEPKKAKTYNWTLDDFGVDEGYASPSPPPEARRLSPESSLRASRRVRDNSRERTSKSPNQGYRKRTPVKQKSTPYGQRGRSPKVKRRGRNMYQSPSPPKRKSNSPSKKLKRKNMEKRQRKQW